MSEIILLLLNACFKPALGKTLLCGALLASYASAPADVCGWRRSVHRSFRRTFTRLSRSHQHHFSTAPPGDFFQLGTNVHCDELIRLWRSKVTVTSHLSHSFEFYVSGIQGDLLTSVTDIHTDSRRIWFWNWWSTAKVSVTSQNMDFTISKEFRHEPSHKCLTEWNEAVSCFYLKGQLHCQRITQEQRGGGGGCGCISCNVTGSQRCADNCSTF